ncbi:enoyl-CoA hydratase-related protein [Caldalkalibacillus uzonensis]|uniref:enoyl-CoA hydratase-related protein n=1 Tax=Caldalkalibacillus uzonensis TaxID=353224 RepID=UPI0027D8EF19|nr:enoyl-CoA hydratase-related protein [Caldalkalibacillus uzonensis]
MFETIIFEVQENVAILTLNRPDKLNAFTEQMNEEIMKACQQAGQDPSIRALIITGAGRAFCAGEDLASVSGDQAVDHGEFLRKRYNPMIMAIHQSEKPVIAAVNGAAAGAGCSLALACDFRIASSKASFIEAFIHIGLVPDSGSCYFLPRLVGLGKALELAILGEKVTAQEALELGLVRLVTEPDQLQAEALAFAQRLAQMPTKAIGLIKRTMYQGLTSTLEQALEYEAYAQRIAGQTADHQEGVKAFIEKRQPRFEGK